MEDEDRRRLSRERQRLVVERGTHVNRIKGLLMLHGVRSFVPTRRNWQKQLAALHCADGSALPSRLKAEVIRECRRPRLVLEMIGEVETAQTQMHAETSGPARHLMRLRGLGPAISGVLTDEEATVAEDLATVFVEEEAEKFEVLGGPIRGTVLHKLMEEVLTGETADDLTSLEERSTELLEQLGQTRAEDPTKGLVPNELAKVVVNTCAQPEVSALRDQLRAEFPVFGHQVDASAPNIETALSGVADALVLGPDGNIQVVVDWKSDVSPTNSLRAKYRSQVRDYLDASGATRGLLVYMTLGQVEEISATQ